MKRTMRWVGAGLVFSLGLGVVGASAQQPVSAEPQAPSGTMQAPREVVPPLPVPRLVKFAGTLKDELGKPRTGLVGVTFAIYKEQESGAALWLETQNVELDDQGRYTVLLGSSKSEGLPLELFTAGEPRWLGVQVNLPKEVEQPRVLLVSVPYALKASDADTLGGKPASVYLTTEQGGVVGTTGKTNGSAGVASSAVSGTGSANVVPKWLDNVGTLGNSQITDDGTNVNMPGNVGALAYKFTGNAAAPTDATATILNQANVGPVFSGLSFKVRTGAPAPGDALSIDPSQNVSITGNASALAYKFTGNANPPTDATATILNQANVGPVFSGLSFKVRTGAPAPGDALTVDQNHNLRISGGGALIFPDGTVQTTAAGPGGGTITAVNTPAGSGLMGGATSGAANLSLINTCTGGQVLQWSGTAWACASVSGTGTVTSVNSGLGLTGGPITNSGTLAINPAVVPQLGVANTFSASQTIAGNLTLAGNGSVTAFGGTFTGSGGGVVGQDTNAGGRGVIGNASATTGPGVGVFGTSAADNAAALFGDATSPTGLTNGLHARSASTGGLGVFAENTATSGTTFGVQGNSSSTSGTGVFGNALATSGTTLGVHGITASSTGGTAGVRGDANGNTGIGVVGVTAGSVGSLGSIIGVDGFASAATGNTIGTRGLVSSTSGVGVLGNATATSGSANGVLGKTSSNAGIAVDGQNLSTTGNTATGTRGFSANPNGQGVLGEVDATGGFSIGVHAIVSSSSGTAGFFENLGPTQGGNLLKADFGATTEFNVDAFGNGFFNGNLGVGTGAPATKLQVVGDIRVGTSGTDGCLQNFAGTALTGTCSSDLRLKKNIQRFSPVLEKLTRLQPVSFYWRASEHPEYQFGPARNSGLIAQDVEKVFPDLVSTDAHGFKMVNYSELPYLMLQAIKDLKSENDTLKEQNAALASALQDQQARLQAIELRLERTATQRTAEAKGH